MIVFFAKYHGAGNDFIVIDDRKESFPVSNSTFIQSLCQRHTGIGADGLLLLQTSTQADARMRIFNADGKEAAFCGNGLRCLVDFAYKLGFIRPQSKIETANRTVECQWQKDEITVDLGPYEWIQSNVPLNSMEFHLIHTGVPHAVAFVEDASQFPEAKELRFHSAFGKEGANVNFVTVKGDKLYTRTFERGLEEETLACGSGAAAVAVAAQKQLDLPNPITIVPRSGEELKVDVFPHSLRLSGQATFVFHGFFDCVN